MLTRADIMEQYKVENGIIRSPGKFEGEPVYVPCFWDIALEMGSDEMGENDEDVFYPTDEDRKHWPELGGVRVLILWESSDGFVCSKIRG